MDLATTYQYTSKQAIQLKLNAVIYRVLSSVMAPISESVDLAAS